VSTRGQLELVSIPTDGIPLDGLHYRPAGPARGGALLMHGNTMNFYTGPPRFLPPHLVADGWECLAFNRRGHDVLTTRNSRQPEGGALQTAAEGMADNHAAATFLVQAGHPRPVVIGHSNGGTLAGAFAAARPGGVEALVLLSAHRGGRDIVARGCAVGHLAQDNLDDVTSRARALVEAGRGDELLLLPGWWYLVSAASFVDRLDNTPDLLDAAESIDCPVLYVVGDAEEDPDTYPTDAFREACAGPCEVVVIDDCDHFYNGREDAVAALVADWLRDVVGPADGALAPPSAASVAGGRDTDPGATR
jgi:pimeloyl-ACP methyl ester carboxylesterase